VRAHLPVLPRRPRASAVGRAAGLPVTAAAAEHAGGPVRLDGATAFRPGWDVVTDMLGQLAGRSAVESASKIDVPLWFVNGKRDHMRLEEKKYLAAAPHARLVVIPGAGHDVSSEAPDEYTAVLLGALADLEAGRARTPAEAPAPAGSHQRTHHQGPSVAVPDASVV